MAVEVRSIRTAETERRLSFAVLAHLCKRLRYLFSTTKKASASGTRGGKGKGYRELRALPWLTFDINVAPVALDDAMHNGKSKPRAFAHILGRKERVKDARQDILGDSGAVVDHGKQDPSVLIVGGHANGAALLPKWLAPRWSAGSSGLDRPAPENQECAPWVQHPSPPSHCAGGVAAAPGFRPRCAPG